jgi:hypothetical protein
LKKLNWIVCVLAADNKNVLFQEEVKMSCPTCDVVAADASLTKILSARQRMWNLRARKRKRARSPAILSRNDVRYRVFKKRAFLIWEALHIF